MSDEVRDKLDKPEEEIVAMAIFKVAQPGADWEAIGVPIKAPYLAMARAAVAAAMGPLPAHSGEPQPLYPAALLDSLAEELAYKCMNPQHFRETVRDALDRYEQEVGRENVPDIVAKAIAEL